MRDDHRVIVAGGDARHGFLAVPGGEGILAGDEDVGIGIESEERRSPLLNQVVGHDDHGLVREAQALHLHSGGGHDGGFAGADAVREQGTVVLQDAPYRVLLVLVEIVPAQHRAVHAGKRQVRAVIGAQAQIVEGVVVIAGEPVGAFLVPPYPFAKSFFKLLLRLAGGNGLLLIDDARVLVDLVVNRGRAAV